MARRSKKGKNRGSAKFSQRPTRQPQQHVQRPKKEKKQKVYLTPEQQIERYTEQLRTDMTEQKLTDSEITNIKEKITKLEEKLPQP